MKGRDAPYKELTDPRNERITSTLTSRAWAKISVLATRSAYYGMDVECDDWIHPDDAAPEAPRLKDDLEAPIRPQDTLIHEARQSSGAIGGKHRQDLVEALQGVREGKQGLSVTSQEEATWDSSGI